MNRDEQLARLRAEYGERAEEAYNTIGNLILNRPRTLDAVVGLHYMFERYGVVIVGAVTALHAERMCKMGMRAREDAAKTSQLVERAAKTQTS